MSLGGFMSSSTRFPAGISHTTSHSPYTSHSPVPNTGRKLPQPPPQQKPTHPTKPLTNSVTSAPAEPRPTIHKTQAQSIVTLNIVKKELEKPRTVETRSFYQNFSLDIRPENLSDEVSKHCEILLQDLTSYKDICLSRNLGKAEIDYYSNRFTDRINIIRSLLDSCTANPLAMSENDLHKILNQILDLLDDNLVVDVCTDCLVMSLLVTFEAILTFYLYSTPNKLSLDNDTSAHIVHQLLTKFISKNDSNDLFKMMSDKYLSDITIVRSIYVESEDGKKVPSLDWFIQPSLWKTFSEWGVKERNLCDNCEKNFYKYEFDTFYAHFIVRNLIGGMLATQKEISSKETPYNVQCVDKFHKLMLDALRDGRPNHIFYLKCIRKFSIYARDSANEHVQKRLIYILSDLLKKNLPEVVKNEIKEAQMRIITNNPTIIKGIII